jgi:hypothetical protein
MSTTTTQNLITDEYGGSITTGVLFHAKNGFTVKEIEFPDEGMSTTSSAKLLYGFKPAGNASTQTLTLSNLMVDPNAGKKFTMAIRPNGLGTTELTQILYRKRVEYEDDKALENLNYNSEQADYGVDRTQYLFSGTKLGTDDLILGGTLRPYVDGARLRTAEISLDDGYCKTDGNELSESINYGHWEVNVTMQALLNSYEPFTLLAGSTVPADDVLEYVPGQGSGFVKFSEMNTISDVSGNFINDFHVLPTKYQIVGSFTTNSVKFYAGSVIPEGTLVKIGAFIAGSANLMEISENNWVQYNYNMYPKYTFDLPQGTTIDIAVELAEGFVVPGGQVVPVGSNTTDVDCTLITDNLVLPAFTASAGFDIQSGTTLTGVIPMEGYHTVKKGMTISMYQPVYAGLNTTSNLDLDVVKFPADSTLESDMTINHNYNVIESIVLAKNSLLKSGTRIPKGSQSLEGGFSEHTITIDTGSAVTSRVDISTPFVVEASTGAEDNPISLGTILKGPFDFPAGTQITSGNILPTALKLLMTMGVTLAEGMELAAGTIFGSSAMLHGDIGFSPTSIIPALSTLNGTFSLPLGTKFLSGMIANFKVPVPDGTVFPSGSTIYAGTSFKEGAHLPGVGDLSQQAAPVYDGATIHGPLTKFMDEDGGIHLVIKAGTVFMPGWKFPVGTIMSSNPTAGHTAYLGTGVYGASKTTDSYDTDYTLAAGSYSMDETVNAPGQAEFNFTPGVPTNTIIVMLTDTNLPTDVVIPLTDIDVDAAKYLSFNESITLLHDVLLHEDYVVDGSNNITWPVGTPIPSEFVLTAAYTFTTATSGMQISKPIQFNINTTSKFVYHIMAPGSSIKLPPAGYTLTKPIKLGVDQAVSNMGSTAFKSTVTLAAGTKLELSGQQHIQLVIPMHVVNNFTVNAQLNVFPQFRLENGIVLLAGSLTPGVIVVGVGSPLPKNITINQEYTLTSDLLIKEDFYTLLEHAHIISGTVLAKGTEFPNGGKFVNGVTMAPILSLSSDNVFFIYENEQLTTDVNLPYVFTGDIADGVDGIDTLKVDASALIQQIEDLQNNAALDGQTVADLQAQFAALQAQIQTLLNA